MTTASPDTTIRTLNLAHEIAARHSIGAFQADDALVEVGLTSLDLVNLMLAVEAEFGIMIPPRYLNPKNFHSITAISEMVDAVRGSVVQ